MKNTAKAGLSVAMGLVYMLRGDEQVKPQTITGEDRIEMLNEVLKELEAAMEGAPEEIPK